MSPNWPPSDTLANPNFTAGLDYSTFAGGTLRFCKLGFSNVVGIGLLASSPQLRATQELLVLPDVRHQSGDVVLRQTQASDGCPLAVIASSFELLQTSGLQNVY